MPPLFASSASPTIDVGAALRDGWQAFRRSPWVFVGFSLLVSVLGALGQALQNLGVADDATQPTRLIGLAATLAVMVLNLWALQGLIRGAWLALEGRKPVFADLCRWNGGAVKRLFLVGLLLAAALIVLLLVLGLFSGALSSLNQTLAVLLPLLAGSVVLLWLILTQHFLAQITLLQGSGPIDTLRTGQQMLQPRLLPVLQLILVEALITLVGVAALLVGVFVAWPVATCVATAAYRQLFGTNVNTDLLAGSSGQSKLF
jgi:hypothetical protein